MREEGGDVVTIARAAQREEDWHNFAPRTRNNILRAVAQEIFGTSERAGLVDEFRGFKRLAYVGGGVTIALQIVATFQLQLPLKHAIVALLGGRI